MTRRPPKSPLFPSPPLSRPGRGKSATAVKDEDFVEKLFVAHTHDTVLCFSNRGKVYWLKVYELPQAGRGARGKPMVNRSEEHTSELQSRSDIVCRLLLGQKQ